MRFDLEIDEAVFTTRNLKRGRKLMNPSDSVAAEPGPILGSGS